MIEQRSSFAYARPHSEHAICADSVVRYFHRTRRSAEAQITALDGVSLAIPAGEIHGLLGPNGAGKTTLVKILSTVLLPSAGRASVLGHDVVTDTRAVRKLIGIVFGGDRGLYPRLTGRQNLIYWAALYSLERRIAHARAVTLLDRVGLREWADEAVEKYSRGMKQRLHLARGLICDASVLFLDEPTTGMDPVAARDFRALIQQLRTEGRTVLLATHDMAEAEALCDRVTLIDRGSVIATETPKTLGALVARFQYVEVKGAGRRVLAEIRKLPAVARVIESESGSARIELRRDDGLPAVLARLASGDVASVRTNTATLEEVYVALMGDRGFEV